MASVSVKHLGGGKYKLRWRELEPGPDGLPYREADGRLARRARSMTVLGRAARDRALADIQSSLLDEGEYQQKTAAEPSTIANLEEAALDWLAWKRTRCRPRSVRTYLGHVTRFFEAVRDVRGVAADRPIGVDLLGRDLLIEVVLSWQELGRSEAWVYSASRSALDLWRWISDDPVRFPGVPVPPREAKAVLPRVPVYVAPPAPTLAEVDACLRHLPARAHSTRRVGALLRFTGLRISQILALRGSHIDLEARTLVVPIGKSAHEQAERRTIPISSHLIAELRAWLEELEPESCVVPAWGRAGSEQPGNRRVQSLAKGWEAATKAGETRRAVWAPPNRRIARPEHAFRAAYQAFLTSEGVDEMVVDALVGHRGRSVRTRHYAGADVLWDRMVEAVALLPAIDWVGPEGGAVIPLRGRRAAGAGAKGP